MEKHVDFEVLSQAIDQAAPRPSQAKGGRPPFPTEIMVRVIVLQQLYNLSDEQMEFQLLDRLSFQRFVGLRHSSQIPDRTTLWTFTERLIKANVAVKDPVLVEKWQTEWFPTLKAEAKRTGTVIYFADKAGVR